MAYRKSTLRKMLPTEREVARLIMDLDRTAKKLKKILPVLHAYELTARSYHKAPMVRDPLQADMLRKTSEDLKF